MRNLFLRLSPVFIPFVLHAGPIIFSTDGTATPGVNAGGADSLQSGHLEEIQFVASSTGVLGSLAVVMESPTNIVENFDIVTDNGGNPGTVIDVIPIALSFTQPNAPVQFTGFSTLNPLLTAGAAYWVSPEAPVPSAIQTEWMSANPTINLQTYFNNSPFFGPQPAPAFALIAAPEPAAWTLLAIGLCGLPLLGQKRAAN